MITLFAIGVVVIGCSSTTQERGTGPVSRDEMRQMGEALHSEVLAALSVTKRGAVDLPGTTREMIVATAKDQHQVVPISRLQSAVDAMDELKDRHPSVLIFGDNKVWTVAYKVGLREGTKRYLLQVSSSTAKRVAGDLGFSPAPIAWTSSADDYVVSFVWRTPRAESTYVELCQNVLLLEVYVSSKPLPAKGRTAFGQESYCNSLGRAMVMARAGDSYSKYQRSARDRMYGVLGYDVSAVVLSEDDYAKFK